MKRLILSTLIVVAMTTHMQAQGRQGAPAPPPPPPAPAAPETRPGPPPAIVNVRIDVTVIDEGGPQTLRETVSLTTTDRQATSSRSEADLGGGLNPTILNVDATPEVSGLPAGKIRVRVGLDYLPTPVTPIGDQPRGTRTRTRLQFTVVLDYGKTNVAYNTSDPPTDRPVRVEVTATLLR